MKTSTMYLMMALNALLNVGIWSNYDTPGVVTPQLQSQWNFTTAEVGLAYSVYSFPNLVIPIAYGAVMDRGYPWFDLPFFIVLCEVTCVLSCLAIVFCYGNVVLFLIGRFLLGLGGEYLLVCQYAAAAKWFPANKMGAANAMIHFSGQTAAFCLFNVFPLIASKSSLQTAFGVSMAAAGFSAALGVAFSVWDRTTSRRLARNKAVEMEAPKVDEGANNPQLPGRAQSTIAEIDLRENSDTPRQERSGSGNVSERVSVDASSSTRPMSERPSTDISGLTRSQSMYNGEPDMSRASVDMIVPNASADISRSASTIELVQNHSQAPLKKRSFVATSIKSFVAKMRQFPKIFWVLIFTCGYTSGVNLSFMAFSTDLLTEKWHVSDAAGARYSSIVVATSIIAAIPFGWVIDRIGNRLTGLLCCAVILIVVFPVLAFVPEGSSTMIPAACLVCLGIVYAFIPTVQGSVYALTLPPDLLSTGFGISFCINMITTIVFPYVVGRLRDWEGNYRIGLLVLSGGAVIGLISDIIALVMDRKIEKLGGFSLQRPTTGPSAHSNK